jgi:ribosome maturation factor RimP
MPETDRESLIGRITPIVESVGRAAGIEVVEVDFLGGGRQRLLRIFIDKPEGVSHGDCEYVSQQVGNILDAEDVIPGENYTLEVSSPGLERKLTKRADYERVAGKKAKIITTEPVEEQNHWEGVVRGLEGEAVVIEPSEGRLVHIPLASIKRANLKFEW